MNDSAATQAGWWLAVGFAIITIAQSLEWWLQKVRRYINGPSPPPLNQRSFAETLENVSTSAIDLAVARERIKWLEEQLEEAKGKTEEERNRGERAAAEERTKGERAAAEERKKGEEAVANERKKSEDKIRALFDKRAFSAWPDQGSRFDTRRIVSE